MPTKSLVAHSSSVYPGLTIKLIYVGDKNFIISYDEKDEVSKDFVSNFPKINDLIMQEYLKTGNFLPVKEVYDKKENLDLNTEQNKLLDKYYKGFVRGGANLNDTFKKEFRKINEELAVLSVQFGENVLKEINKFEMVLENEEDLEGLPENVISGASETAKEKGYSKMFVSYKTDGDSCLREAASSNNGIKSDGIKPPRLMPSVLWL